MKKFRKLLAVLMCLCMVFSLIPMTASAEEAVLATEDEIIIYYTNDVHTYIDKDLSYDNIADLKTQTASQAAGVLLVDAGDHVQGTAYGSMDKGATIIELMNAAGYDLATLGNHEFDYGMDGCMNVIEWAEFPYVSANFYHEDPENPGAGGLTEDGWDIKDPVLEPFEMFEVAGVKIAIIGVTTPESFTKSTPAYFQDENGNYIYGIAGGEDGQALYDYVQLAINAAQLAEADVVIALAHLGDDPASQPWTSEELIANTTGLDAVIDGHSHSTVEMKEVTDEAGNTVILTQTGEYFGAIGRMSINVETKEISTGLITEYTGSDETVAAIKDAWIAEIDTQLGEVIGHADVVFDNYDASGRLVRKYETNTGDFAADALYYLFKNMDLDVDVAIMNGGGVRNKTITGDISYKTCKDIHTFGNVACLQTITGQQLLDALEWGARSSDTAECGGFLHVSGIVYTIDNTVESTVQMDDKGVWTGGPTGEYRVRNVYFWNEETQAYDIPLDLEAKYNLAGYNYTLRDLGDGFAMFDGAVNVVDYVMEDYMVLANYVKSFPVDETTGLPTITAENSPYGSVYGEGRITLVEPFVDVTAPCFYYDAVIWAVENGITNGISENLFAPGNTANRGQVVTFLWRMMGEPEATITEVPFTDVNENAFYYDAMLWAYENGVTTGTTATTFAPNGACDRGQVVTFLWRALGKPEATVTEHDFTDVSETAFYYDAMLWAVENGITNGTTATTFEPGKVCDRATLVTFLYRARNIEKAEPEMRTIFRPLTVAIVNTETFAYDWMLEYVYDDNGTAIELIATGAEGEELSRTVPVCDDRGFLLSETYVDSNGAERTVEYTYDKHDLEASVTTTAGTMVTTLTYTRDDNGYITEYTAYVTIDGTVALDQRSVVTNNENGDAVREEVYSGGVLTNIYVIEYDENGNRLAQYCYDVDGVTQLSRIAFFGEQDGDLYCEMGEVYYGSAEEEVYQNLIFRTYDQYGNLLDMSLADSEGNMLSWEEYTYLAVEVPVK